MIGTKTINFKDMSKLETERSKVKRYCKHCGHSVVLPKISKKDKVICRNCGYYIFKSDKIEFEERLKNANLKLNKY